ncbi:excisionase family DNA-binding protein [Hyphomicrobium zavarzinii]|uniref:excisionase family DNA-binding protein n=1 Tax=Hyphomicrobium zavarzinii TaxID=48292 RepID=UPI00036086D7
MTSATEIAPDNTERIAYRPKEACKAAGVGKTCLYEALKSGALRSRLMGRKRLIMRDDLQAWLKGVSA